MIERRLKELFGDQRHNFFNRIQWQTTEIQSFVILIRGFARYLQLYPLKVPSGHYDESLKMEGAQIDIVNEMVQELSSLPRFIA